MVSDSDNGSQMFTNVDFKVAGAMPIVTLLDITFNPLVILSVWSPIPDIHFDPGILKYEVRLLLFPIPNPFPGFFFDSLKRPDSLNFGVINSRKSVTYIEQGCSGAVKHKEVRERPDVSRTNFRLEL